MNLLSQIKPISNTKKITTTTIEPVEPLRSPTLPTLPTVECVTSLDSGEVTTINETTVNDIDNIDNTEVNKLDNEYQIYDVQSGCYRYLIYDKEFAKISNKSKKYISKFSSYIELMYGQNSDNLNKRIRDYLDTKYDKLRFKLQVTIQTELNIENIIVDDYIHFEKDKIIIPPSYDTIIDYILNSLDKKFKVIELCNIQSQTRDIKPTNDLKILQINQTYCHNCKFFSICDENNKIGG